MSSYLLLQVPKFDTRDAVSRWWLILERRLLQSWTTNSAPVNCQLSAQSHMRQQKHTKSRTCSLTDTVKPTINITSNLMTELHRVHNDYSSFSDAGLETWGENRPLGERVLEPSVTETVSERKQNDKHNPGCQITIVLVWMCFCYCSIFSFCPVQSMTTSQAGIPSKPWHGQLCQRRALSMAANMHVCSREAVN